MYAKKKKSFLPTQETLLIPISYSYDVFNNNNIYCYDVSGNEVRCNDCIYQFVNNCFLSNIMLCVEEEAEG